MYRLNYMEADNYWDMKQEFKDNQELIWRLKKAYKEVRKNRKLEEINSEDSMRMISLMMSESFWTCRNSKLEKVVF